MSISFAEQAVADLAAVVAYIGEENPRAASRVAVQIVAACDRLEYLPERGRPGRAPDTREITALRPDVIVYRLVPSGVEIMRIWHGAQDRD